MQRWRVPLGFLCGALFIWLARPNPLTLGIGGGVALVGLALRAWAAGHIRKNSALAQQQRIADIGIEKRCRT